MRKKIKIKIISMLLVFLILILYNHVVFAAKGSAITKLFDGNTLGDVDVDSGVNMVKDVIGIILAVVRIVAISLSIIILTWLGIRYMSAAPSEKANIKNQMITFTVGVVVVVASTTILEVIRDYAKTLGG